MKALNNIQNFYFLGIGGIGMSALARYFKAAGKNVAGYDKTSSALTQQLEAEGMHIHYTEDLSLIPEFFLDKESTQIVITPAIPADHSELIYFKENNFNIAKRSAVLGSITKNSFTIAVAGTHGKTTTSSMVAHLLKQAGKNVTAFLGGITQNYRTNLLLGNPTESNHVVVVEADEYDRSFLTLYPDVLLVTSLDADHLDIYGSAEEMANTYQQFVNQVKPNGTLIFNNKAPLENPNQLVQFTYSFSDKTSHAFVSDRKILNHRYSFSIKTASTAIKEVLFGVPGLHNMENAVGASIAAMVAGLTSEEIKQGLETFKGVNRRFDYHIQQPELVLIDDYAHHPEEIKACLNSVNDLYPGKRTVVAFQPHLFTRTRDFIDAFAESLSLAENVLLLEIYPARELPLQGVNSSWLLSKITSPNKQLVKKEELANRIKLLNPEVVVMMGAGDIDRLIPEVKNTLLS